MGAVSQGEETAAQRPWVGQRAAGAGRPAQCWWDREAQRKHHSCISLRNALNKAPGEDTADSWLTVPLSGLQLEGPRGQAPVADAWTWVSGGDTGRGLTSQHCRAEAARLGRSRLGGQDTPPAAAVTSTPPPLESGWEMTILAQCLAWGPV